jgi:hypothetical protein
LGGGRVGRLSKFGIQISEKIDWVAYLAVVLEPLGSDFGDGVVLVVGALGHSSESGGGSIAHGLDERVVDAFLQIGGFL